MGENSNQLSGLLTELESFLTDKHGAEGSNLMEKLSSLKGTLSDELHGKISGVLGQIAGKKGLGSLLSGFLGNFQNKNDNAIASEDDGDDADSEHVDSVRGILGELQSMFHAGGSNKEEEQTEETDQADEPPAKDESDNEGSLLGNVIDGVMKAFTEK